MARRSAISVPVVTGYDVDAWLPLGQAVALVADRDTRAGDDVRTARDRARKLLTDNANRRNIGWDSKKRAFRVGPLATFLRQKFPGKYQDLPAISVATAVAHAEGSAPSIEAVGHSLPPDLVECHREISRLVAQISKLNRDLRVAYETIARLQPLADKWQKLIVEKNRTNAKK